MKKGGYFAGGFCNADTVVTDKSIKGIAGFQKVYVFITRDIPRLNL